MYVNFQIIKTKHKRWLYADYILPPFFIQFHLDCVFLVILKPHKVWYCFSFIFSRFPPQTFSYQIYVALVRLAALTLDVCAFALNSICWMSIQKSKKRASESEKTENSVKWIETEKISLFHAMKIEKGQTNKNTYPKNPNITTYNETVWQCK